MSSSDELLLVQELPMDMHSDGGAGERRLAHVLPPLACAPGLPPFRPPPPPSAAAAAEFRVAFRGWLGAPRHWELWVAKLRPIHERLWREHGIFDAVLASTYRFKRDASAVLHLASFWSPGTNTFAFPWGEATLTLEDVAVLGGFPTDGSPVPAPLPPQWGSDEAALNGVRLGLNRSACKKAHHAAWIKHFLTDTDMDTIIEHAAFLALWLTRFVLPGHPESTIRQSLFPLAVRMARGDRVALGPAVLASLYRDLREMKTYLVAAGTTGGNAELLSPLSVYAPLHILQLWIWERFPVLCDGKANPIKDAEPWAARWHDVSKKINPTVIREVLSSGKNFMWKPYPSSQQVCKQHSGWVRGSDVTENGELISLAHCLRACELVGADSIEQYLPHRVAMQFGLDQDVPGDVHRANEDCEVAWETYDLEGKNLAIFIPHSEPGVTARYAQWWRQPLPSSDLDTGAGSISVEVKVSKRKVKKTLAAMEAEAEKERKMKKARISPNHDKKRKLEEVYDAKLSDWLATARNGSSRTGAGPGGSCKRGSSPKYDDGSDNSLLASVGTGNDDIVPPVPRKQASTPAVNMNLNRGGKSLTGSKYEGANLKGYMASDVYHPVNEPYFKEEEMVSTEISTFNEDAKGEWSSEILKNADELVREETPDVPNSADEFKPPLCMVNEECSDHLSEVDRSEDDREEAVIVDKPTIFSSAPEGGNDVMPEEKMVNLPEDKCLHATDTPEEGANVTQELEEKANLVVDESSGMSNRSEEVTALVMEEREEKGTVTVDNEGTVVSERVRTAGTSRSIEVIPGSKQGVYTGVMNIPQETVALAEEILPVQQTNYAGECVGMSCIMEDTSFAAEVRGTNDGETTLDFVSKEKREISCIEEIGGEESNPMAEKDIKQKPEEAPQVDIVECEDITLVEKDSEGENQNVAQILEYVVTDNNIAAVLSGFPEERSADEDKALNLAKKDADDMHKEVVEVEDAKQVHVNTLANVGANEGYNKVAEVEHIDMTEANIHAQFDIEKPEEAAEVGHADMDDCKRSTERDTDREPGDVPEVANAEVEKARERIENNNDDKLVELPDVAHAEMEEADNFMKEYVDEKFEEVLDLENIRMGGTHGPMEEGTDGKLNEVSDVAQPEMEEAENLMKEYVDEKFEEVFYLENIRMGGTHGPMEEGTDGKLNEVSDVAQPETNDMKGFIKDDADDKFQEISGFESIEMDRNYGPMEKDTDGKLNEVSDVAHPQTKDMKDFITDDSDDKFQEISEFESIRMDKTHVPMEEDTDGKLKGVPEVSAEVEQANGTESNIDRPSCILQVDPPARGEARCLVEEDIEEDNTNIPQVKHAKILDEAPVEKDSKENPNADGKDLPEKEVHESKEVYQAKQAEGVEYKVLREKDTEKNTKDALGVKQAEEQQGETPAAEYMHDYIEEVTVAEHVDGQSEKLAKIGAEENPEEIAQAHGKEFDNDTMESLKNSVDSEIVFSSASIQSKEEQTEVFVENITEKQCLQDVDLINERESLSDGAVMEIQGADDLRTLDMHDEVSIKQIHEHGMISEDNKTQILEDSHIVGSGSDYFVVMEVDEAWSTAGTHNQEALDLDKQQTMEERLNLGTTIKNNKITMPGHAIMPGCSEFQTDSPETNINVVMPTEGILIKEELALEKGLECKITEGNGRPLVVTNILGGGGVDTNVVTVDVNKANCVEGIQNQEACSTEELQARQDKQHTGAGDVRILEDTSINYIGYAGTEKDLCMEKDPAVLEKQDEGMADENTERTLVDIDAHESGEVKHDGTMKMIHETDSRVQAVNMAEDKISLMNKQKGVPLGEHSKSDVEDSGSSKKHDGCSEFQTDSPETKINEVMSTEGIQSQEDSLTKEEPALENGLECKFTEGNGRPLVVTNILCGGGVNTTVVTVDVNKANCVEGIRNQEACSTEELQARQDNQHTGAGDVRILEDASTNCIGDAGTEKDLRMEKVLVGSDESCRQDPAVLEKQDEGTTDETERALVDIDAPESGEVKHDGTMKMIHETDSRVQAVNMAEDTISFKNKQKGVPLGNHNKSDAEGSGSNQTARKEFKGARQPDFEHEVEVKQEILEDKTEMSVCRKNDEASEQDQTPTEDATIAHSGMDRGENNNEQTEEPVKGYGKCASDPVNTGCQTSKFGRPSIEEVRRIHSVRSIYLKDIKESQGRTQSEPSNRTHINNAGYSSRHGIQEPITVRKDIKVPSHDTVSVCGRDRALELVTGPPEETPRWRQEQHELNILEDVQNARIAEKTRMEMEIRILKAQIISMQKQVMNMDHAGEVISRSKRH